MRHLIPFWIVFLVSIGMVGAISTPMPISAQIINEGRLDGYEVRITNMRTGEAQSVITDGNGWFLFDWSNSKLGWIPLDNMKIEVLSCLEFAECTVMKQIDSSGSPISFKIDLIGVACPVCEDCPVCPADTTPYKECDSCCPTVICPDCPDVICDCPDVPVCEECPECPVCPQTLWEAVILVVCFALGLPVGGASIFYFAKTTKRWKKVTQERIDKGTVKKEGN